jgi:hypothetical protein
MFFKGKSKSPLVDAVHMAIDATMIAYVYQQDREYRPSEKDLRLFEALAEVLSRNHSIVQRIARNMHRRAHGEPEEAHEFIPTILHYL